MENPKQPIIDKLNSLIAYAEDGKMGYEAAANNAADEKMKILFQHLSNERATYVADLQKEVNKMGGNPENNGGPMGALHRVWLDVKSLFASGNKEAIINTCITGEEAVIAEYESILEQMSFEEPLKHIVTRQLQGVKMALSIIQAHVPVPTT